jgi:hypothetical protein
MLAVQTNQASVPNGKFNKKADQSIRIFPYLKSLTTSSSKKKGIWLDDELKMGRWLGNVYFIKGKDSPKQPRDLPLP